MSDDEEYVYENDSDEEVLPSGAGASKDGHPKQGGAGSGPTKGGFPPGVDYRLLAESEIAGELSTLVGAVASTLSIPPACASLLLSHYKYSVERAVDAYSSNPVGVCQAVGIVHKGKSTRPSAPFPCQICLEVKPMGFAMGCGHPFCVECWGEYLAVAVKDTSTGATCPEAGCKEALLGSTVSALAAPAVAAKWHLFERKNFVAVAKNMAWCPGAGCSNAFVSRAPVKTVKCPCGSHFCFKCGKESHAPVTCERLESWLEKCGSESETANWILVNTKKCPACASRIEKNQGCNHIKCINKACRHEFCWICLAPWSEHGTTSGGFYKCNKYKASGSGGGGSGGGGGAGGAGGAGGENARIKADLERYLFYFQRYMNHEQAGKYAVKHRDNTQRRMGDLAVSGGGSSWSEVAFLELATEALIECRRVLKHTYAHGYYMVDGGEKRLFEHLQEQLERSTEHLQELTEAPLEKVDRGEVINFTSVTKQFLANLLQGMEDGLTR